MIWLSLSIDTDHLACIFLISETHKAAVLTDCLSDKFLVPLVRGLLFHKASIFRVVERASVWVNWPLFKFLNDRLITFFEDNNQLRDKLKVFKLLNLVQVDGATI